ncbi:zf-HC2 domain-containing protein [Clostridium sp. C2-6-12]|uniref:anti-sigma factor family protein n=1 Tax=Clostridium sp. C2-6-12 TaxID=2698832 RepID=UPI0013702631|nr:zf-HC2 domain-containing protein [Clostridium sp. C2-6-12]
MSCKLDKQLLYSLADNTIEPLERIFVEEHLKYCDECKKELQQIKELEAELSEVSFEIPIPEKLSVLSQLLAENCIDQMENQDINLRRHNYEEEMKVLRRTIIEAYKVPFNNPYNKFVEDKLTKAAGIIGKPVKNYCNKKMSKIKLLKLFKVV